jgi:hypothetical protein
MALSNVEFYTWPEDNKPEAPKEAPKAAEVPAATGV